MATRNESRFPENVKFGDIISGLPIPDNSCKGVYCSHVLEHLSLEDFRIALVNTRKILKNTGCFRLVLPDLEYSIKKYIDERSKDSALIFLNETSLGKEKRSHGLKGFISEWFGNSQHLWMWDYCSISQELKNTGFINIRRAEFGDSTDPMFNEVEERDRWLNCLSVECIKADD
jgi:predicted SAM-dependent methyltransferase